MALVIKLAYGGANKRLLKQEIKDNNAYVASAIQSGNLSQQQIDALQNVAREAQSFQQQDPLHKSDARHYQLEISRRQKDIVDGKLGYDPNNTEVAYKNALGYYGKTPSGDYETSVLADETVRRATTENGSNGTNPYMHQFKTSSSSSNDGNTGGKTSHFSFKGFKMPWKNSDDTLQQRIDNLKDVLKSGIGKVITAKNEGKKLHGLGVDYDDMLEANNRLDLLVTDNPAKAYSQLAQIASRLGLSLSDFDNYFDEVAPKETTASKNRKALLAEGFTDVDVDADENMNDYLRKIIKKGNYKFMVDLNGDKHIYNSNYEKLQNPLAFINDDDSSDSYHSGLFSDSDGKVWFGNSSTLTSDDWAHEFYRKKADAYKTDRDKLQKSWLWDIEKSLSEDDLINKVSDKVFTGKNYKYSDVSKLFGTDTPIIAIKNNGKSDVQVNDYGRINWKDTSLYILDEEGNPKKLSFEEASNKFGYNPDGFGETDYGTGDLGNIYGNLDQEFSNTSFTGDEDFAGRSFTDFINPFGATWWRSGSGLGILGLYSYAASDNIKDDKLGFFNAAIKAIQNPNGRDFDTIGINAPNEEVLDRFKYNEDPLNFLQFLYKLALSGRINVTAQLKRLIAEEYNKYKKMGYGRQVTSQKDGGVLYAEKGVVVTTTGDPIVEKTYTELKRENEGLDALRRAADLAAAQEAGYGNDVKRYKANTANLKENFGAADALRMATMAQDVASIVASFTGAGAPVAAGLGVTAMATDMAADIMDDSVSAGLVAKNALINAGFAAIGMIPGAKVGKVTKNIIKYAPKIMFAASAMGIAMDESTLKTFLKLNDGTASFTREDWKNIGHVLTMVAAGTRGARNLRDTAKTNKEIYGNIRGKVSKSEIKSQDIGITNEKGEAIPVPKEVVASINKLLKSASPEEIEVLKADLKARGGTEESVNKLFEIKNKSVVDKLKALKEKKDNGTATEQDVNAAVKEKVEYKELKAKDIPPEELEARMLEVLNRELLKVDNMGTTSKWFAETFGGGALTGLLRAILRDRPDLMKYRTVNGLAMTDDYYDYYNANVNALGGNARNTTSKGIVWGKSTAGESSVPVPSVETPTPKSYSILEWRSKVKADESNKVLRELAPQLNLMNKVVKTIKSQVANTDSEEFKLLLTVENVKQLQMLQNGYKNFLKDPRLNITQRKLIKDYINDLQSVMDIFKANKALIK